MSIELSYPTFSYYIIESSRRKRTLFLQEIIDYLELAVPFDMQLVITDKAYAYQIINKMYNSYCQRVKHDVTGEPKRSPKKKSFWKYCLDVVKEFSVIDRQALSMELNKRYDGKTITIYKEIILFINDVKRGKYPNIEYKENKFWWIDLGVQSDAPYLKM